jgi:hypothetical protein
MSMYKETNIFIIYFATVDVEIKPLHKNQDIKSYIF